MPREGELYYLRGRPLPVGFLGFESDTFRLQQAGWQIAESSDRGHFQIALRHPQHGVAGVSDAIERDRVFCQIHRSYHGGPEIRIEVRISANVLSPYQGFLAVDTTPAWEPCFGYLMDAPYFRPIEGGREIFLKEATMEEILHIALAKQEPERVRIQEERAAERRREGYRRSGDVKAKLILA